MSKRKPSRRRGARMSSEEIVEKVNAPYAQPLPPSPIIFSVDAIEFSRLGAELQDLCPRKYDEILVALRKIVDAQRTINGFERPAGAWEIDDALEGERTVN